MIGDVGYDSRQNPAPAIGTNWSNGSTSVRAVLSMNPAERKWSEPPTQGAARLVGQVVRPLGLQLQLRIVLGSSKRGTEDKALAALHWQRGEVRGASSDAGLS